VPELTAILDRLERALGPMRGDPIPLEGGITNRNFLVSFGGRDCVLRLPGRETSLLGISREAERLAGGAAADLGIAPAILAADDDCMVTEYLDDAEPFGHERLRAHPEAVATALRAFHDCGVELPVRFWVPELLEEYASTVRARGARLPEAYSHAQALGERIARVLPLSEPVSCHDDLLPGNVLRVHSGKAAMLVDWEYAGMGHRLFDLGNVSVNHEFDEDAENRLLSAYFGEPPGAGVHAALRLMRLMSDAREAAWGVVQSVVSELDVDFDDYASSHFARLERAAANGRVQQWLEAVVAEPPVA
jgi:thiamine kinase-like enzyme